MAEIVLTTITVRVLLFASYAELLGRDALELQLESPATVADAIERLRNEPGGNRLPAKLLCALNLAQVGPGASLKTGDELALLPPLAGG